ncbi:Bcr/CflA family drug resistance efflux transporter [Allostella sp. ATCC 35155]|nr:Bcr/CflA family drug resistance efflux transporter [Stella sp. ATCC 35155]
MRPEAASPPGRWLVVLVTALVALGPVSTDLYLPSLPALTRDLGSDVASAQLTLSLFLVAFACCQLVYGPLSDRFGRRPVVLAGTVIYLAATVACMLAPTMETLIAARFLQAVGACAGPVLGRAIVRDIYGRDGAARVLAYVGAAMALAPAIGPILGGFVEVWVGWRGNFALLAIYAAVLLAGVALMLSESNHRLDPRALEPRQLARNYAGFLRSRRYLGYAGAVALGYCGLFAFISGSAHVLIDVVGLTPDRYGFCFAAFVVGYAVGTTLAGRLTMRLGIDRMIGLGAAVAAAGGLAMAALAWADEQSVAAIVGPSVVYMLGVGMIFPNAQAGAMGPFPTKAGAAAAMVGFLQMAIAAAVGILVGHAFDGTSIPMATAIGAAGAGLLLVRFVLLKPENPSLGRAT